MISRNWNTIAAKLEIKRFKERFHLNPVLLIIHFISEANKTSRQIGDRCWKKRILERRKL